MSVLSKDRYPVDVCYMVADLKYNKIQGVKICEIQQASLSLFNGDTYRNLPEEKSIHKELLKALSSYNENGLIVSEGIADKNLVKTLSSSYHWGNPKDLMTLFGNKIFTQAAKQKPKDKYDLSSYLGFLYISWSQLSAIYDFEKRIPGMVVIDKGSFPFWIDKYRMTRLFNEDDVLSNFKPKWGSYKKKYTKKLADQIANDLGSETFVIKPRGQFMGKGVIIVQAKELDEVLRYIITKKGKYSSSNDPAYSAWKEDSFDSFIVEEFVVSDIIRLPHLENKRYQPTMRVAFLLTYNNKKHDVHFLGGYWKTPHLSLDEEGSFMEKNKDICEPPFYRDVGAKTMSVVQSQLRIALPRMHSRMLNFEPEAEEEFYTKYKSGKIKVSLEQI